MKDSLRIAGRKRRRSPILAARDRPEAFGDVFVAYHQSVLRYMVRRTFDPEVAFDLMSETFAQMLANLRSFEGTTELQGQAWMWAIARSQLTGWHRRGLVADRYRERLAIRSYPPQADELERIEELADIEPLRQRLHTALETLAPAQRRLLQLRIVDQWSYDEIAQDLAITTNAARLAVARALAELTEHFHHPSEAETTAAHGRSK